MANTYPIVKLNILGETITFRDEDVIEAEVTQEIHPVGIEVPASTARIRVWLDDTVVGAPVGSMLVEGAGTDEYNGYYLVYGAFYSYPRYRKVTPDTSTGYAYIIHCEELWMITPIGDTGEYSDEREIELAAVYSSDDVDSSATPDLVEAWVPQVGASPAPTVTAVSSTPSSLRDKFSPFSDSEYYQAMASGLVVDVSEYVDGAEQTIGRFYLEEWNNPKEGEFELVCTDLVGTLENKNFLGNFYETPALVSKIVGDILGGVGVLYEIDSTIASKLLKGYIPGNITLREALQQVLFACGAYALTTGDSKLKIKESIIPEASFTSGDIDVTVTDTEKTASQSLNIQPLVTGVEIMSHDYAKGATLEEIFSATLPEGDYLVVYPKPYWSVIATGVGDTITYLATTNDAVLVTPDSPDNVPITTVGVTAYTIYGEFDFGVNYVYLHVPAGGGTATITGYPWLDATQIFSWTNPDSGSARPSIWKINNATLVPSIQTSTEETITDVLARIAAYASKRYLQKITLLPRTDIDLGNIALVTSLYGKDVVGVVERMSSNLSGGYLIETEIVGTEHTGA